MKLPSFVAMSALFLLICLVATVTMAQTTSPYTITASLDHETYDSMTYVRFSIDKPHLLSTSLNQQQSKLFDIQLPNAWSNIQDSFAECTRPANLGGSDPMFTYVSQASESRGYELMYPRTFDKDSSGYKSQLNCVIKIRAMPQYNSAKFSIVLLAATPVFQVDGVLKNTQTFSFQIPQLLTGATTSSRTFPQAHPFIYAKDLNTTRAVDPAYATARTKADLYTTALNIDQSLLALRKNNKLLITHPFPFQFSTAGSFCTSPHDITPYDFDAQAPVSASATLTTPVTAIAISLSAFSGSSNDIACQISINPVLQDQITSYPAGRVSLFLEYSYYNKTGTSSFSNFYKTFTQRTFEPIDPKTIFPAFDPATILATPPIALRHQVELSPVFLAPKLQDTFWNRYNIKLETFAFEPNQTLLVPAPPQLTSSGGCLDVHTKVIQIHNCVQIKAEESCPDFDFQLAVDSNSNLGVILTPKKSLRFLSVDCYYNFSWKSIDQTKVPIPQPLIIRLVDQANISAVTETSFRVINLAATTGNNWIIPTRFSLTQTPSISLAKIASDESSFKSPLVGGKLDIAVDATPGTPLSPGFRIEIMGPRLTRQDSAWISMVKIKADETTEVDVDKDGYFTLDPITFGPDCWNCFKLTTELLQQRDPNNPLRTDLGSYYFPVLTYVGDAAAVRPGIVSINYPGFQIPLTDNELTLIKTVALYHYDSALALHQLQMPDLVKNAATIFYTLSKEEADVEEVFRTISWWKVSDGASPFALQSTDDDIFSVQANDATANTGSGATGDEWFIYQQGYIGLLFKNTKVNRGDEITISGTSVILQDNITSITNIVYCFGSVYTVGETLVPIPELTNVQLLTIETSSQGISGTMLMDITEGQAFKCTATVVPRYPASATELFQIPTLTYYSSQYSQPGTDIPSVYSTADYLTDSSSSSQTYPFTYELPVDISNVVPQTIATLTNVGQRPGQERMIYSGSYVVLSLEIAGATLDIGTPSAIQVSFGSPRLTAPDVDITTLTRLPIKPTCPNADVSISYSQANTAVTITLNQKVVATVNDPYVCQFIMMVGAGSSLSETGKMSIGSSGTAGALEIGEDTLTIEPSPYEIGVTQSNTQGSIQFAVAKLGPMPVILHNTIPFTTIDPFCRATDGTQVAKVELSTVLGMIVLTPLLDSADSLVKNPIVFPGTTTTATCTFSATKKFNSATTSVRFQTSSLVLPETLTLPAVADIAQDGIDVSFSSITPPLRSRPITGLLVDVFHQAFATNDYIQINLPPAATLHTSLLRASDFPCESRFAVTSVFQNVNATVSIILTASSPITIYDEVQCSLPLQLNGPISKGSLNFITVKQAGVSTTDDAAWVGTSYTSTLPQISSSYKVATSYGLQWSSASGTGELQLVLDAQYTTEAFNVRSNTLTYDLGGMKSPSDVFNSTHTRYAGGDPTVNTWNPDAVVDNSDDDEVFSREKHLKEVDELGIVAGAAVISSKLTVSNCFLPYTDNFGALHSDRRVSSQYIRETGHKLVISLPVAQLNVPVHVRCIIPIYIYNQEFVITPRVSEYPTNNFSVDNKNLASVTIATWFPSPAIVILNDAPAVETPPEDQTTPSAMTLTANRPRYIGSSDPSKIDPTLVHSSPSSKSAQLLRLQRSTKQHLQVQAEEEDGTTTTEPTDETTDGTTPTETVLDPSSSDDLTQDIRYMEILFIQSRYFNNAELDDIVKTIHSLVSKRDRTINLNSLLVLAQNRPPIDKSDNYVLLRIGFAGLDVESTLLEAKLAGLDFTHWLSTNYEVASYTLIDGMSGDYRYQRSKVPIQCLKTAASINEITQTCGADCGRLCPTTYNSGELRVCRTDRDCESLTCDTTTATCQLQEFNFVTSYTGIYSNYKTGRQTALTFSEAYALVMAKRYPTKPSDPEAPTTPTDPNAPPTEPTTPTK